MVIAVSNISGKKGGMFVCHGRGGGGGEASYLPPFLCMYSYGESYGVGIVYQLVGRYLAHVETDCAGTKYTNFMAIATLVRYRIYL